MRIVSLNVGLPRTIVWKGKHLTTGIFKEPRAGRVMLRTFNFDGDRQADLSVHGGSDKAVYGYPSEHYDYWRRELPGMPLPWGAFGENLTTEGLLEGAVCIGDRFRVGAAEVIVTQPRMPCYKLGIKFGRDDIIKRFLASERSGVYFRVLNEGEVGAGDVIERVAGDEQGMTVTDILRLYVSKTPDRGLLRRAIQLEALAESWRRDFQAQLDKLG